MVHNIENTNRFFLNQDVQKVYRHISKELLDLVAKIKNLGMKIDVRPELTGKATQFGSLEEIISLSREIDWVHPCIDWSHLHARTGAYNTGKEFQSVVTTIRSALGNDALKQLHMHISGIEYTGKGERKHLNIDESDYNYCSCNKTDCN